MSDLLHAFMLPELGVRGASVRLRAGYREILAHQPYPAAVQRWLGEAMAASALLMTGLKFVGRLSLQLQGGNALELMYSECTSEGDIRGIARWNDADHIDWTQDFATLSAGAVLAITLEPYQSRERYQGIVAIEGADLADALEGYFAQSEQLPTRLLLAADGDQACGLLVQRMPSAGGHSEGVDPDGWNRVEHLIKTVTPPELLGTDTDVLLHRLFHDVSRSLRDPLPLHVRCRCTREKVADVLRRIGRDEALAAGGSHGNAQITCEFCGRVYEFDSIEIETLFRSALPDPPPASLQ